MKTLISRNIITLLSITFLILTVNSCGSKKTITTGGVLEEKSSNKIINDAIASELKYSTLTTKGSIEFKIGNTSKKSSAVFKIIKDSIMQASVRPVFGVEAFKINFTPDSVIIIDRLKKQYIAESIKDSKLMANFDFNYYNLQALFTNQLFAPGKQNISKADYGKYNITSTDDVYMLQTKDKGNLLYNFAVDASNRIVSTLIYNDKKSITLQWSYNEFIKEGSAMYPTVMNAQVDIAKKRLDIEIAYSKLDIDKDLDVDTTIPSKYTKVDFSDFVGTYIKKK